MGPPPKGSPRAREKAFLKKVKSLSNFHPPTNQAKPTRVRNPTLPLAAAAAVAAAALHLHLHSPAATAARALQRTVSDLARLCAAVLSL